jgi:hypothetical protein
MYVIQQCLMILQRNKYDYCMVSYLLRQLDLMNASCMSDDLMQNNASFWFRRLDEDESVTKWNNDPQIASNHLTTLKLSSNYSIDHYIDASVIQVTWRLRFQLSDLCVFTLDDFECFVTWLTKTWSVRLTGCWSYYHPMSCLTRCFNSICTISQLRWPICACNKALILEQDEKSKTLWNFHLPMKFHWIFSLTIKSACLMFMLH